MVKLVKSAGKSVSASSTPADPTISALFSEIATRAHCMPVAAKLSGPHAFAELLRGLHPNEHMAMLQLRRAIEGACTRGGPSVDYGFMNIVAALAVYAIRHGDIETFLKHRMVDEERAKEFLAKYERERREYFVQRMKLAKALKRSLAAIEGGCQ